MLEANRVIAKGPKMKGALVSGLHVDLGKLYWSTKENQ